MSSTMEGLNAWVSAWGPAPTDPREMALLRRGQIFNSKPLLDAEMAVVMPDPQTESGYLVFEGSWDQLHQFALALYQTVCPDWEEGGSVALDGLAKDRGNDGAGLVGGETPGDGLGGDAVESVEKEGPAVDQLGA